MTMATILLLLFILVGLAVTSQKYCHILGVTNIRPRDAHAANLNLSVLFAVSMVLLNQGLAKGGLFLSNAHGQIQEAMLVRIQN
jgi:hypothetical protein